MESSPAPTPSSSDTIWGWDADLDLSATEVPDAIDAGVVQVVNPDGWLAGSPILDGYRQVILSEDTEHHGFMSDFGNRVGIRDLRTSQVEWLSEPLPVGEGWTYFLADATQERVLLEKYWQDESEEPLADLDAVFSLDLATGELFTLGSRTVDDAGIPWRPPGEFSGASILGGNAYWIDVSLESEDWALWSAPLDGSRPAEVIWPHAGLLGKDRCAPPGTERLTFFGDMKEGSSTFALDLDGSITALEGISEADGTYLYGAGVQCGNIFAAEIVEATNADDEPVDARGQVIEDIPDRVVLKGPHEDVVFQSDAYSNFGDLSLTPQWFAFKLFNGDALEGAQFIYHIASGELFTLPRYSGSPADTIRLHSDTMLRFGIDETDSHFGLDHRRMVLGELTPPGGGQ